MPHIHLQLQVSICVGYASHTFTIAGIYQFVSGMPHRHFNKMIYFIELFITLNLISKFIWMCSCRIVRVLFLLFLFVLLRDHVI